MRNMLIINKHVSILNVLIICTWRQSLWNSVTHHTLQWRCREKPKEEITEKETNAHALKSMQRTTHNAHANYTNTVKCSEQSEVLITPTVKHMCTSLTAKPLNTHN